MLARRSRDRSIGTPLFVYDETHLRNRCREAIAAFGADRVVYATKAFLCTAMARLAHEEGLLLDVATGGELFVALRAGVPADRCVMHGNNKSVDELRFAMTEGVRHVNVDSFAELDRIEALYAEGVPRTKVQLRITPGVHAHTHEYIATGQDDSKFGFNLGNGEAARAVERVLASPAVELVGLHCHIGSNVFAVESFGRAAEVMAGFANPLGLPELTLGGGLGVAYVEGEEAPTLGAVGQGAARRLRRSRGTFSGVGRTGPLDRGRRRRDALHRRHGEGHPRASPLRRRSMAA